MKQIKKIGFWLLVLFLLILICMPGIWIFISAFRPNPEILAKPANWIPDRWTLHQFTQMFSINGYVSVPAFKYLMNSVIISSVSTVIAITIGMMGGYAFARFNFKGKKYFSKSDGIAYFKNKENRCEVNSQSGSIGSTMMGEVVLNCKKGLEMTGGYRQTDNVGKGDGVTSDGNNVVFEFYTSKSGAIAKLENYKIEETQLVERKLPTRSNKKIFYKCNICNTTPEYCIKKRHYY